MVRNRNRCNAFINGTTSVVLCEDPFDSDRTTPKVADPTQVCPRHSGARECGIYIDERHRPLARNDDVRERDRKSTRLNSSHGSISYAVFCLKKKKKIL